MKVIQKRAVRIKTDISLFSKNIFYCPWVDTSARGVLIPEGITHPFSQCPGHDMVYYWKLQFLNNVIIIKTKVLPHEA
jgi:hypothetical protein